MHNKFLLRQICSLDHLSSFCSSKPKCSICVDTQHEYSECPLKEDLNIPDNLKACGNCGIDGHSARDFDNCPKYKEALQRRYGNLNWLDQTKHERYSATNGLSPSGPKTYDLEDKVNFDGEIISADLPPDIVRALHEST